MISRLDSKLQQAMKKNYILGALAVAAMTIVSCSKEQDVIAPEVAPEVISEETTEVTPKGIPFVITAGSTETKTTNTGNTVKWAVGDQIALWHAETTTDTYVADGAFEAATAAATSTFSGTLASALDPAKSYDWYAIYPYESGVNTPDAYNYVTIGSAAGSAQVQTGYSNKNHLSGTAFPLYGKVVGVAADTQPEIAMKHIASVIEFNVTNNYEDPVQIQQIQFSSSAASDLIGTFQVDFADGSATLTNATTNSVSTLNVDDPVDLANGESAQFYMAINPFSLVAGQSLTVTVKTSEGTQVLSNIATGNFTFAPGKIHTLNVSFTNKTVSMSTLDYTNTTWLTSQSIDLADDGKGTNLDGTYQDASNVGVVLKKNGGTTAPVSNNTSDNYDLRIYKKNQLIVGSNSDKIITKIIFTGSNAMTNLTADGGTFTASSKSWVGRAGQVIFTVGDSQSGAIRINSINVYYEDAEASEHILAAPLTAKSVTWDETPVFIPLFMANVVGLSADGTTGFTSATPTADGLSIVLANNTSSSPRNVTVTVTATNPSYSQDIVITQGGKVINVSNISGIKDAYDTEGGDVNFSATLSNALVTLLDGSSNFYLQDETGAILGYTGSHGLAVGDKISGILTGSVTKYRGNYEITGIDYSTATVTPGNTVTPTTVDAATLSGSLASYESKLVKVENMTVASVAADGKTLTIDGTDVKVYNKSGFALPAGSVFHAEGAAAFNNSGKQITVVSIADGNKVSIVPTITISNTSVSVGSTVTLEPTINSTGAVTFTSLNTDKATVNLTTGVVTGVAAGDATIRISVAADGYWAADSKDITVTVSSVSYEWVEVTSLTNITSGEYIIINNGKYLPSTTTTSSPVQADAPTVNAGKIADADVTEAMKWTFSGTYSAMNITNSEGKYLCINGKTNSSLRVTNPTNPSNTWVFEVNDTAFAMKYYDTAGTPVYRFCATYSAGSDWRTYNSATAANYGDEGRVHVYKKTVKSE